MKPITFATAQAESSEVIVSAVCDYLAKKLEMPVTAVHDISWQERIEGVKDGRIDIGWICGSYYTWLAARPEPVVELFLAPVMAQERYQGEPYYYSDVVVFKDSPYRRFEDLRGAVFASNEPGSMSGNWTMRYHLAKLGEYDGFFGQVVYSGAHVNSLQMIVAGEADAAAIDSMVMAAEVQDMLEIAAKLRIVAVLGPTPIPPWVIRRSLPEATKAQLRQALLSMTEDEDGRKLLAKCEMRGFSAVTDAHYDLVREMLEKSAEVTW